MQMSVKNLVNNEQILIIEEFELPFNFSLTVWLDGAQN